MHRPHQRLASRAVASWGVIVMTAASLGVACLEPTEGTSHVRQEDELLVDQTLGFADLAINATVPAGTRRVCYALRVARPDGITVWALETVCSDAHGDGPGGDLAYIGPCDDEHATNVATIWVQAVELADPVGEGGRAFANPCPIPDGAGDDPSTWTGGCQRAFACIENVDVRVIYELELGAARAPGAP